MTVLREPATPPPPRATPERPEARCGWCGRRLPARPGPGRPRRWCKHGCRQQAYLARKLAGAHGLGAGDVVIARDRLEELQGLLYCLEAAIEDVDRDRAELVATGGSAEETAAELTQALDWLLANARPLAATWIEPRTADDGGVSPL